MNKVTVTVILVLASWLGFASQAVADVQVSASFSKDEARIIATWFLDQGGVSKPRGKGKKAGGLPPGIAKNLARGKPLPPGIAKQYLPGGLVDLLPRPPVGYERIIVDGKVLLVEVATRVVHDILTDIVLR